MTITEQIDLMESSLKTASAWASNGRILNDRDSLVTAYGRAEYVYGAMAVLMGFSEGDEKDRAMRLCNSASDLKTELLRELRFGRR